MRTTTRCNLVTAVFLLGTATLFGADRTAGRQPSIATETTSTDWPRPCLLVPELPAAPKLDGVSDEKIWTQVAAVPLTYPLGSNKPTPSDTEFRAGHFGGVLYLLVRYQWPHDRPPVTNAKERDGALWQDDGGEVYFAPVGDLDHPRQLSFNLAGVRGDRLGTRPDEYTAHIKFESEWNPDWKVACRRDGKTRVAEMAIPLAEITGLKGVQGDAFRFNLMRNRADHQWPYVHWSPVDGRLNCRPDSFGFAVLTGRDPLSFRWEDISSGPRSHLVFSDRSQARAAVTGYPLSICLFNPVAAALPQKSPLRFTASLKDQAGKAVASRELALSQWPQKLTVEPGPLADGAYRLELSEPGEGPRLWATTVEWRPSIRIQAEDRFACQVQGKTYVWPYPRSVGQMALLLNSPGTKVSVSNYGSAVYLCLPPTFPTPGVNLGSYAGTELRCRVDDRPAQDVAMLTAGRLVPLAENLAPGSHTVVVELVEGHYGIVDGFLFARQALAGMTGHITADEYSELLTDVRADIVQSNRVVRSDYVRNPVNGLFELFGLDPGSYRVRVTASGWLPYESKDIVILRAGHQVDLGVICLRAGPQLTAGMGDRGIGYGKTANVTTGGLFSARLWLDAPLKSAQLVSRYKTIDLSIADTRPIPVRNEGDFGLVTFRVPSSTPHDLYALKLKYEEWSATLPQAVCVREPLPEDFHVAAVGHMNTWGQQTSEYLARVAETAQLAGARVLLIANEVNPVYLAGALESLRIPYLVTAGNHSTGRWDDFFGPPTIAYDDGPMRVVRFSDPPDRSWIEAGELFRERKDATCRVLLCFEAFPPADLVRESKVDLLFDGHSDDPPRNRKTLPKGTLHLGLADDQQEIRWIPLTDNGLPATAHASKDIPAIAVPRGGRSPLRVEFSAPNDGTATGLTARVINECRIPFHHARIRFEMTDGQYVVDGGKLLQQFTSDNKKITVVDAETSAGPGSVATVSVCPKR